MQHINLSKCTIQVPRTTSLYKEGKKFPASTVNPYAASFGQDSRAKQGNHSGETPTSATGRQLLNADSRKMPTGAPGHQLLRDEAEHGMGKTSSNHHTFPTRGPADLCWSMIAGKAPDVSYTSPPFLSRQENAGRGREGGKKQKFEERVVYVKSRSPGKTSPLSWSLAPSWQERGRVSWPEK